MNKTALPIAGMLALCAGALGATSLSPSRAANWLNLASSAPAAALGGGMSALGEGLALSQASPAALAGSGWELLAGHEVLPAGVSLQQLSAALYGTSGSSLSMGLEYMNYGEVTVYQLDSMGQPQEKGSISPYGLAIKGSYASELAGHLRGGVAVQAMQQSLGTSESAAVAADLGLRYGTGPGLSLGASLSHLGSSTDGLALDAKQRVGLAYQWEGSTPAGLGLDAVFTPGLWEPSLVGAAQVALSGVFQLRGSFQYGQAGAPSGYAVGASLPFSSFELSYTFQSMGDLGPSHFVSLAWHRASPAP